MSTETSIDQKIYFTTKDGMLYCIFTNWTEAIEIKLLKDEKVKAFSMLGYKSEINWQVKEDNKIHINIQLLTIDKTPCKYTWVLRIDLE